MIDCLGPHDTFYDLCGGGCSLILAKPRSMVEVVNDRHAGLINFLRVVGSFRWRLLDEMLAITPISEVIFQDAARWVRERGWLLAPDMYHVDPDHVQAAYYTYVLWWMGVGGMAGTQAAEDNPRMSVRYTAGGRVSTRFRRASENIKAIRARINRVEFWCQDLFKMLPKIQDRDGTVIYCDPPWLDDGDVYAHRFTQGEPEAGQMVFGERGEGGDDYDRLAAGLGRFSQARVVVRLGDNPRLARLFPESWTRIPIERTNQLSSQGRRDCAAGPKKAELLLINHPMERTK